MSKYAKALVNLIPGVSFSYSDDSTSALLLSTISPIQGVTLPTSSAIESEYAKIMLVEAATLALTKSDITMLRCTEAAIAVPAAWNTYRKSLRAISIGTDKVSTSLPIQPPFVAGT